MSHQLASINLEWLVTVLWSVEVFLIHYFKYLKLVNEGNRCLLFCWVALFLSLFADNEIASICRLDQLKCLNTLGMITWNDWFQENGFILCAICLCHHFVILCSLYKLRSVKTTNTHTHIFFWMVLTYLLVHLQISSLLLTFSYHAGSIFRDFVTLPEST